MNRLLIASAVAVGACAVAVPAFAGLAGNPSFSRQLPVNVPSQARLVDFDDSGRAVGERRADDATPSPARSRSAEPGDDSDARSGPTSSDDGADDSARGGGGSSGTATRSAEPGDDRGGRNGGIEPGDDSGSRSAGTASAGTTTVGTDDRSGRSGSGSGRDSAPATTSPATRSPEPGDDHGSGTEAGDDSGGHGGR